MDNKIRSSATFLYLGVASVLLGGLHTYLFFGGLIGLNYPIFILFAIIAGYLLTLSFGKVLTRDMYIVLALAFFFAVMVFVRSSEILTFFNIIGSLLLLLIAIDMHTGKRLRSYVLFDLFKSATLPFRFIVTFFKTLPLVVSLNNFSIKSARTKEIIRGALMTLVALTLFAWLFSGADATFAKFFNDILNFKIDENTIGRTLQTLFVTAFFVGAFGFMFNKLNPVTTISEASTLNLGLLETTILLSAINILFLSFILLQISVLFGGQTHITAEDLTYAEYARNGFFQLVWVAIFSFGIITFIEKQISRENTGHVRAFKVLSGILVVQVIIILASAFQRLTLYEEVYGFTDLRIYSHALMIWLAVGLILQMYGIWKNEDHKVFSCRIFASVVMLLFAMNVFDPEVFIAKMNMERFERTGMIDVAYLTSLSPDALPYTIELLDDPDDTVRNSYAYGLYVRNLHCESDVCTLEWNETWKSRRQGSARAFDLLNAHKAEIEASKDHMITLENETQ